MGENPIYPKLIKRPNTSDTQLNIGEMRGEVEYTSDWEVVEGGFGVSCRTWIIKGVIADVDGADIKIKPDIKNKKPGYTPIQLVQSANVVVDAPESGKAYCVIRDTDGIVYVNYFDQEPKEQMVLSKGMVICWIAETEVRLTEFESPMFNSEMFMNIPDDLDVVNNLPLTEYREIVNDLRGSIKT